MDIVSLRSLKPELDLFLSRYLPLFGREENYAHAMIMIQGLLAGGDRRNVENIAEHIEGGVVRTLQKFVAQGSWKDELVLGELRKHVVEVLGENDATLIIDETGFPKKGMKSAGVARQYAGIMGRTDNCQIGVFMSYCSARGHTLCDRRLFLPDIWTSDRARCDAAGVPPGVIFRTKPELAAEMLENAARSGMPFQWVAGDALYGSSPTFVRTVRALNKWYTLDVSSEAHVWTSEPQMRPLGRSSKGQLIKTPKALTKPRPVPELIAEIPATAWKRITIAQGSQGPRIYEFAEIEVWFSEESLPATEPERLLFKRSIGQDVEIKFQRSNAPTSVSLKRVAEAGGCRWSVEQDFQCGKGECGLDEYETRGWVGWHHHTALSMLSLWYLTLQKERLEKKTSTDHRTRNSHGTPTFPQSTSMERNQSPAMVQPTPASQRSGQKLPYSKTKQGTKVHAK